MKAKERLYLTAARDALVGEGSLLAATLYAAIGDEIPASAAEKFGLVDGMLPGESPRVPGEDELLRVRAIGGVVIVEVAGLSFGSDFRVILDNEIDEAQLLAILKDSSLEIEAALIGDPSPAWVPFPHREEAINALQAHIDYDLANNRPHDRVGTRLERGLDPAPPADPAEPQIDPAEQAQKEAPGGGDKEQKGGENKEAKPGADKTRRAARSKAADAAPQG